MKILFITLSNIGDAILTLPTLDALRRTLPRPEIMVLAGPRAAEVFRGSPFLERLVVYDKHVSFREKIRLFLDLRRQKFDVVVDLRNSFLGVLLPAKYKTSGITHLPRGVAHMKERHLYRIRRIIARAGGCDNGPVSPVLYPSAADVEYAGRLLAGAGILAGDRIAVIAAGARSHIKKWPAGRFLESAAELKRQFGLKIVLAGDKSDSSLNAYISRKLEGGALDLSGLTTIPQLAAFVKKAAVVITNDSALLHLASYLDAPVAALFGPTNEQKYGPWSAKSIVIKKDIFCRPCEKAQCLFSSLKCLQIITVEDVLQQIRPLLDPDYRRNLALALSADFKRILVVRTDRIGDVLLSTPVIRALRERYRHAYIAAMVSPYARDIVEGNPYLDEVVVYDKERLHRGWQRTLKFAGDLRRKKFDLAVVLHPTNRAHLIVFLAGIPLRLGYDRKLGFLLTDRVRHLKQEGEKHELEYNLDLLAYLGVEACDKTLLMPIKAESERWAEGVLKDAGVAAEDKLLAIHPGASCPSKIWPPARFAEAADRLAEKYGFRILIVAGAKDAPLALEVARHLRNRPLNLAGRTSVSQLASLIRRASLFISNDSGPVHIASAVGTPVIAIFGRSQKGLSPRRWGPVGAKDRFLHKEAGCITCLAHNCHKGFACLKSVTIDDVLAVADTILEDER